MTQEPPYKPSELPDDVVAARKRAADDEAVVGPALRPELDQAVTAARIVLDALAEYHASVADRTDLDPSQDPGSRSLALWESMAAAIGLARAFVDLVDLGYDAQTLPLYRALHEILGVVSVLDDTHETKFLADWLSDAEVRQKEVRAAETRNAERMREQLGLDDLGDPGNAMRALYGPLSDVSHGRRSAVRTYVSPELRAAVTGPHPSSRQRLATHETGLALVRQVVLVVGGALATLYGGTFYTDRIQPLDGGVEAAAARLARIRKELER
jgi:hypothetical protein